MSLGRLVPGFDDLTPALVIGSRETLRVYRDNQIRLCQRTLLVFRNDKRDGLPHDIGQRLELVGLHLGSLKSNCNHDLRSHAPHGIHGNILEHAAVNKNHPVQLDRRKDSGQGHCSAHRDRQ